MFVKYIFKKDFNCDWLDECKNFAYVPTIVDWAKSEKYWNSDYKKAKAGDLVIYNWYPEKKNHYSHVGIVKEVKSSGIVSIEGNTTNALGKKNCVAQKSRNKKYVAGIVKLPYVDKFNLTRLLKKGCKGNDVKEMQKIIGTKVDGVFGKNTLSKLKTWQANHGLKADGVVGANTAHSFGWLFKGK
jgi:peptidoglycan hydrolase-like protein with peptidoglycan-binding domain